MVEVLSVLKKFIILFWNTVANLFPCKKTVRRSVVSVAGNQHVQAAHTFKTKCAHSQGKPNLETWRQPVELMRVFFV